MANVSGKSPYSGNLDGAPVMLWAVNEMLESLPYCELKSRTPWTSCSIRLVESTGGALLLFGCQLASGSNSGLEVVDGEDDDDVLLDDASGWDIVLYYGHSIDQDSLRGAIEFLITIR